MSVIENYPGIRPILLLDPANSGSVDPRISCVRPSTATCGGPDGALRSVANNVPRIDYHLDTGRCLGLLVEESRTNTGLPLIASGTIPQVPTYTYNATLPALVQGRVPVRNYAVGAVDATNSGGDRANIRGNPANLVVDTTYSVSIYACGVPGGATRATMLFQLSGMPAISTSVDLVLGRWRRLTLTFTVPAGAGSTGALRVAGSGGSDPLQPFGVDGYQFEIGASASSFIPTVDVAVTRAADQIWIDPVLPGTEFTVLCSFVPSYRSDIWPVVFSIGAQSGASGGNVLRVFCATSNTQARLPGNVVIGSGGAAELDGTNRVAVAVHASSGAAMALNGASSGTTSSSTDITLLKRMYLGSVGGTTGYLSGRIRRLAIYPKSLTAQQLQRLTA